MAMLLFLDHVHEITSVGDLYNTDSRLLPLFLQADFLLPHRVTEAKFFNKILPPGSASVLPPQVRHQLLSPVYHKSQTSLVALVLLMQIVRQHIDFGRQDSNLHLGGASILSNPFGNLDRIRIRAWAGADSKRLAALQSWWEDLVGSVPAKLLDASLHIHAGPIFGAGILQRGNGQQSLGRILVRRSVLLDLGGELVSSSCHRVGFVCQGLGEPFRVLQRFLDVFFVEKVVEVGLLDRFNGCICTKGFDKGGRS